MDTRSSFSSICMLWISVCVGLHSGESVISVSGEEGSTAVLPCELESVGTETPYIRWSIGSKLVFERNGIETSPGEGYEGRVDVPVEEFYKGDCSLVLRNLKFTDSFVYKCSQQVRRTRLSSEVKEISSVSLSVSEKPPELKVYEVRSPRGDSGMMRPHPLIMAFIACSLVQLF